MPYAVFYVITFIVGLIIQFGCARYLAIGGFSPNVLLVMLIFVGLMRGSQGGQVLGFAWGLAWDVMSVDLFGSHTLLFTGLGYATGKLSRQWNESKMVTQMLLTGIASVLFWVGMLLLYAVFSPAEHRVSLSMHLAAQILLNMLIAPVLYHINRMIGITVFGDGAGR
jgi:rod shape-determining protein MreD